MQDRAFSRWFGLLLSVLLMGPAVARAAQEGAAGGTSAEYEERLKRLDGIVEALLAAQAASQKRIAACEDEIRALRSEHNRALALAVKREEMRDMVERIAEKVREVDRKREEDKKLILEEIRKLAQTPMPDFSAVRKPKDPREKEAREVKEDRESKNTKEPVKETKEPRETKASKETKEPQPSEPPPPVVPQNCYEYVIKQDDTISAIVVAYQQSGVKVTVSQVLKANPGVNPNRLRPGQKLFIPDPAPAP